MFSRNTGSPTIGTRPAIALTEDRQAALRVSVVHSRWYFYRAPSKRSAKYAIVRA
jgi:hypothetical protein